MLSSCIQGCKWTKIPNSGSFYKHPLKTKLNLNILTAKFLNYNSVYCGFIFTPLLLTFLRYNQLTHSWDQQIMIFASRGGAVFLSYHHSVSLISAMSADRSSKMIFFLLFNDDQHFVSKKLRFRVLSFESSPAELKPTFCLSESFAGIRDINQSEKRVFVENAIIILSQRNSSLSTSSSSNERL